MTIRAVFSFHEPGMKRKFHVYKHTDGHPAGAVKAILNALPFAHNLPKFEADDFAASFIAGNKTEGGGVKYSSGPQHYENLDYHYEIWQRADKELLINAWRLSDKKNLFFFGPVEQFVATYKSRQAA